MNLPSKLFELQKVADKLYGAQKRIYDIDQLLANNDELNNATQILDHAQLGLHTKSSLVKEKEELEKELLNKISFSESTLYGGMVKNPKELQDLQKELDSLKKRKKVLEDEHLSAIGMMEETQQQVDTAESNLVDIKIKIEELSTTLKAERDILAKQIMVYNQEYVVTSNNLPADMKLTFESLFRSKKGKAVAVIEEGSCSVCGITVRESLVQQIKTSSQIVYCPSCGRMLFTD
jgi:uncharacterized protein